MYQEKEKVDKLFEKKEYENIVLNYNKILIKICHLRRIFKIQWEVPIKELKTKILANIALALLLNKKFQSSIKYSKKVLEFDPSNEKSKLRMAYCYSHVKQYEDALKYYREVKNKQKFAKSTTLVGH